MSIRNTESAESFQQKNSSPEEPTSLGKSEFIVTTILITLSCLVYFLQFLRTTSDHTSSILVLQSMGGNLALLSLTGDGWRLLLSIFLHIDLLHLLMNMYMLLLVGSLAERWYGRMGMLCIYLVGGAWSSYASALWNASRLYKTTIEGGLAPPLIVSAGGSGAIMALCGALLAARLQHFLAADAKNPEIADSRISKSLIQVIGLNLLLGFFLSGVDQAAHIGGVAAGLVLGMSVGVLPSPTHSPWRRQLTSSVLGGLVLGLILHFSPWLELRALRAELDEQAAIDMQYEQASQTAKKLEQGNVKIEQLRSDYQRTKEKAKEKANNKEAIALLAELPPPVSEEEATGKIFQYQASTSQFASMSTSELGDTVEMSSVDFSGKGDSLVYKKQMDILNLANGKVKSFEKKISSQEYDAWFQELQKFPQERRDELELQRDSGKLQLIDSSQGKVIKTWEVCDTTEQADNFQIIAAAVDSQGKTLLASINDWGIIRVTQLETGIDIGLYPTPTSIGGRRMRFSADAKHIYLRGFVKNKISFQTIDLNKRFTSSEFSRYPLICIWPGDLPE